MASYTINVGLNAEESSRLTFLSQQYNSSRRSVAYDLLATAIAEKVIGSAEMRRKYEQWQRQPTSDA